MSLEWVCPPSLHDSLLNITFIVNTRETLAHYLTPLIWLFISFAVLTIIYGADALAAHNYSNLLSSVSFAGSVSLPLISFRRLKCRR